MKRHWKIVLLILVLWPLSPLAIAQELEKLAIGHSNLRNDIAALWVPNEIGIFRKNGLDPNIVLITGGQRMTQALLSASAPLGFTGATPVVTAVAGGAEAERSA
jgi:ABC-type nitrate/sulfonate/bicarbonate transport system substrate-binding protein